MRSADEYAAIMNGLKLANPAMMDVAVPANLGLGLRLEAQHRVPFVEVEALLQAWPTPEFRIVDLREDSERRRFGAIPGAVHVPYDMLASACAPAGTLAGTLAGSDRRLLLYCAVGERSTLAVETVREHGIRGVVHLPGGFNAWQRAGGPVATIA